MGKLENLGFGGVRAALALLLLALVAVACHADEDDPKGQSEELADAVRREHAIERLNAIFHKALTEAKADRSHPAITGFADATVDNMVKTYIEHPEDSVNGLRLLSLMQELNDPRTLPAMLKALEWTQEVTEDHAVTAALGISKMDVPADKKSEVVAAVSKALERVDANRGVDNRMRKAFIELLGELNDKAATPTLVKVMETQSENQNFLFNILAAQQLVKLADPKTIPNFIKALYLFDVTNPAMRMNDVAASGLVAIGKLSLSPLLETLAGKNEEANKVVKEFIETIRHKDPDAAAQMDEGVIIASEATYSLGKLGYPEAIDALLAESKHENKDRRFAGAIALVSINRRPQDTQPIVDALIRVYNDLPKQNKPQALVAIRHLYADEVMPFLLKVATTEEKDFPPIQMYGFVSYASLANKAEAQNVVPVLEGDTLIKGQIQDYKVAVAAAKECDENIDCWIGKLTDKDTIVLRKAANMLARFGRGNDKAISALLPLFAHQDLEVRNEALYAVDYMAVKGSKAAVAKIDEVEDREEGRSSWNNFKREALPARARLALRAGS